MIVFVIIISHKSYASPYKKDVKKAVLLSLFFPGGGQFYLNMPIKGLILGSLQIVFLGLAGKNYLHYKRTNNPDYFRQAFGQFILFFGTRLYSVADAYVSSSLWNISAKVERVKKENMIHTKNPNTNDE